MPQPNIKVSPQGIIVDGEYQTPTTLLYLLAKAIFGADANGIVTIPASLTAAPTSLTHNNLIAEIKSKT